jgi:hypothetical protein
MVVRRIAVGLLLALGLVVGWSWWNSDERRIGRRLDDLLERAEKAPGENQLVAALKAEEIAALFADPFDFRARQFDFATRDRRTLVRTIALYRMRSDRIAAQVLDRRLDVAATERRATMSLTVRFVGGWQGWTKDAYRFQIGWREQEGEWRIDLVDLVELVPAVAGP